MSLLEQLVIKLLLLTILELEDGLSSYETESDLELSDLRRFNSLDSAGNFSWFLAVESLSSPFSTCESGLWVIGSIPFCLSFFFKLEFHRFFISLSVLPGNCAAIWDHLWKQKQANNKKKLTKKDGPINRERNKEEKEN